MISSLEAEREINQELQPEETLVWIGQPNPARAVWSAGAPVMFLFGLVFTVFAFFWTLSAAAPLLHSSHQRSAPNGFEIAFPFFGAPFILVGLSFLLRPYWMYRLASQTIYAVTSKRLVVISGMRIRSVQSINPDALTGIDRLERPDGTGDIVFRSNQAPVAQPGPRFANLAPGFYGIPNVRDVESTIRNTFPDLAA